MNAIVAVDKNWAIGKDGDLLCHLPGDLKYFKQGNIPGMEYLASCVICCPI